MTRQGAWKLTGIVRWQIGWLVGSMLNIVDCMSLGVELGEVVGINQMKVLPTESR